jgi:hypothetical protein
MLLFLLGLLASVPLAILANMLTPRVTTAFAERSAKRRRARIAKIRREMARTSEYRDGPPGVVIAFLIKKLTVVVLFVGFSVIFNTAIGAVMLNQNPGRYLSGTQTAAVFMGVVTLVIAEIRANDLVEQCRRIYNVEWYARRTARELRKLGEPELLDEPQPGSTAGQRVA